MNKHNLQHRNLHRYKLIPCIDMVESNHNCQNILWEQFEKERLANWRYTSKAMVFERLSIVLEALKEDGLQGEAQK